MPLSSIETAIDAVRRGGMVILVDDEDRENEGDLVLAADKVTPEAINFMAMHGRGLICLSLTEERLNQLQLPMMVEQNSSQFGTAFTVSIEAREGVTTGISAADRARTVEAAVAPGARPEDLVRPGHIFPLRARRGGVGARCCFDRRLQPGREQLVPVDVVRVEAQVHHVGTCTRLRHRVDIDAIECRRGGAGHVIGRVAHHAVDRRVVTIDVQA